MAAPDMDVIKEIPGYKVILKAILKTQIQQLVEQLASHTDEESVILTASVSDGTLSHLGSDSGKFFLDDHDDIKSQFLGFCLKRHHKKKVQQEQEEQQKNLQQQLLQQQQQLAQQNRSPPWSQRGHGLGPRPRHGTPAGQSFPRHSVPRHPMSLPSRGVRHEPYPISNPQRSRSIDNIVKTSQESGGDGSIVKQEPEETSQSNEGESISSHDDNSNDNQGTQAKNSDFPEVGNSDSNLGETPGEGSFDPNVIVKMEEMTDADLELEITGVELGADPMASQKDLWAGNMSMGYDSSGATGGPGDMQIPAEYSADCGQRPIAPFHNRYPCYICGKSFPKKYNLDIHKRLHNGEKPFCCSICSKRFTQKSNLKTHMIIHFNPKNAGCAETYNRGVKRYPCIVCGRHFPKKYNLDVHMRTHNGEKPFECSVCQKRFSQKSSVKSHMLTHLRQTLLNPLPNNNDF